MYRQTPNAHIPIKHRTMVVNVRNLFKLLNSARIFVASFESNFVQSMLWVTSIFFVNTRYTKLLFE